MPLQNGRTFNPEAQTPVGVFTINPTAPSNLTALSEQPRTPQQVAEENAVQVKQLPQPIRTAADLPSNAQPGMLFTSAANPTAIYVLGYDNIWRAWSLLPLG